MTLVPVLDHTGFKDKYFVIAGKSVNNTVVVKPMVTKMTSPGFVGSAQKHECLNFWFYLEVCKFLFVYITYDCVNPKLM